MSSSLPLIMLFVTLPLAVAVPAVIYNRLDWQQRRIAHFTGAFRCADCGLELTARTVWTCPQCGAEIMRLLRMRRWPTALCFGAALLCFAGLSIAGCFCVIMFATAFRTPQAWAPFWYALMLLLTVSTAFPAATLFRLLLWRYVVFDGLHCVDCGYELRGNLSGRCPECGTDIPVVDDVT